MHLQESRGGRNVQHKLVPLLRQSVYSRLAGYEDTNDTQRLAPDPAMRLITSRRASERHAPISNTLRHFETKVLTYLWRTRIRPLAHKNTTFGGCAGPSYRGRISPLE